eukprot:9825-Heterococcus_DN1.PRE.1
MREDDILVLCSTVLDCIQTALRTECCHINDAGVMVLLCSIEQLAGALKSAVTVTSMQRPAVLSTAVCALKQGRCTALRFLSHKLLVQTNAKHDITTLVVAHAVYTHIAQAQAVAAVTKSV